VDSARDLVAKHLVSISWHNLDRIKLLYKNTLGVELDESVIDQLRPHVKKRHDIIHRNGRTVEGDDIEVTKNDVENLKDLVEKFVIDLNAALTKARKTPF